MKKKLKTTFAVAIIIGASIWTYNALSTPHEHATCYGKSLCNACSSCNYCGHCAKNGGTCGVCR